MRVEEPNRNAGHLLSIAYLFAPPRAPMMVADVQLFGALPTPKYQVAVGRIDLKNPEHVRALPEDVRYAQAIKSRERSSSASQRLEACHFWAIGIGIKMLHSLKKPTTKPF
jgi:hypothetical protein